MQNKWVDEAEFAIDSSTVPRGGHRRRKSMEPKSLSTNENGSISASDAAARLAPEEEQSQMSPTKEFLNLSSPAASRRSTINVPNATTERKKEAGRRVSFAPCTKPMDTVEEDERMPATFDLPATPNPKPWEDGTERGYDSPATPYFLHDPSKIQQQTCPPKSRQPGGSLFPVSGRIEEQSDEAVRRKLQSARRKTMQFAPLKESPLKKGSSRASAREE